MKKTARKSAGASSDLTRRIGIAAEHFQAGRFPDAQAGCQRVLAIDPDNFHALHLLGLVAHKVGDQERAFEFISRALERGAADSATAGRAQAYHNLGVVLDAQDRSDEAVACYEKAIALKPDFAESYNNLGVALNAQGRSDEAVACYEKAIALKPDHAEAYNNLGVAFKDQGKRDAAVACYRKALAIRPDYADAYNSLGVALYEQGRLDEARSCHQRALAIRPDHAGACHHLGELRKDQGEFDEAAALFRQALSLEPDRLPGLASAIKLAIIYYLQGELRQAAAMTGRARPILGMRGRAARSSQAYFRCIEELLVWWSRAAAFERPATAETLYVVGESHMLSAHNVALRNRGRWLLCQGRWIEGCKQWHLGNAENNRYKRRFIATMESIPRRATILMTVGEIDCRHDEGIIKAWQKSRGGTIEDLASRTAAGYLNYVAQIAARRDQKIIIGGIPATNVPMDRLAAPEAERFTRLLGYFNRVLRELALTQAMDFLDVFALTDAGDGTSNRRWHLDTYHLRPDAVVEAFEKHYVSAATGAA